MTPRRMRVPAPGSSHPLTYRNARHCSRKCIVACGKRRGKLLTVAEEVHGPHQDDGQPYSACANKLFAATAEKDDDRSEPEPESGWAEPGRWTEGRTGRRPWPGWIPEPGWPERTEWPGQAGPGR